MNCFKARTAAVVLLLTTGSAARAEPPTCGAPTAIDILRDQAKEHLSATKAASQAGLDQLNQAMLKIYFPSGDFDIQVDQMFAVSRSEDVRECRALMHLVVPGRVNGDSQVFYSVARSEDGQDLVAINGDQALYGTLLRSLEANNSDLRDSLNAFRRELFSSGNNAVRDAMRANPGINKPSPFNPHASSLGGNGNAGSANRGFRE